MMALSGVRSSWLTLARKRLFTSSARSASARACSSSSAWRRCSVTSRVTATTLDCRRPAVPSPPPGRRSGGCASRRRSPAARPRRGPTAASRCRRNCTRAGRPWAATSLRACSRSGTVADMDALQQAVALQGGRHRRRGSGWPRRWPRGRGRWVVPGHEVVDGREQHAVAALVVAQAGEPAALVAEMFEGLGRDVADRRDGEDRHRQGARPLGQRRALGQRRQQGDREGAEGRDDGGRQGRAPRARDHGLQGDRHQPDRGGGVGAAGHHGEADHHAGEARPRRWRGRARGCRCATGGRRRRPAASGWRWPGPRCRSAPRAARGRAAGPASSSGRWRGGRPGSARAGSARRRLRITDSWTSPARRHR